MAPCLLNINCIEIVQRTLTSRIHGLKRQNIVVRRATGVALLGGGVTHVVLVVTLCDDAINIVLE